MCLWERRFCVSLRPHLKDCPAASVGRCSGAVGLLIGLNAGGRLDSAWRQLARGLPARTAVHTLETGGGSATVSLPRLTATRVRGGAPSRAAPMRALDACLGCVQSAEARLGTTRHQLVASDRIRSHPGLG